MPLLLALLAVLLLAAPARAATEATWIVTLDGPRTATTQRILDTGAGALAFEHLPFVAIKATPAQLRAVRRLPGVARVDPNSRIVPALAETRAAVGVEPLHVAGVTGAGITVAQSDSGVDGLHPDLGGAVRAHHEALASTADVLSLGWAQGVRAEDVPLAFTVGADSPVAQDATSGHGTHVAGIAVGRGTASGGRLRGIAPGASLVSIGHGDAGFVLAPLAGWDWLLGVHRRLGVQAVNNSWVANPQEGLFVRDARHPINVASKRLHDEGVAVVFAAGNVGPAAGTTNVWGGWPWTITVGNACIDTKPALLAPACEGGRPTALATTSSRGTADGRVPGPDLVAPGTGVISLRATGSVNRQMPFPDEEVEFCGLPLADVLRYTCISGTSMAAPHVTGTIALMEQAAKRDLTPDELKKALVKTARPLAGHGVHEQGAGMLDAAAAVRRVG